MHYYQFNIGDYRRDSGHLSLLEHGIYRSLLDTYYLNESPLCEDDAVLMRTHSIRTDEEEKAFKNVLADFFILTKKGYTHKKCSEQIKKYNAKSEKARLSAKVRWDAKAMRTHSEGNANHKPLTKNHKPTTNIKDKVTSSKPDPVMEVFSFWCTTMKKQPSTTKLTPKRMQKIKDRLKDYKIEDIKQAITNCSNDPFSMGKNDRQKKFNDIELICRNGEKLEGFFDSTKIESESANTKRVFRDWANEGNNEN